MKNEHIVLFHIIKAEMMARADRQISVYVLRSPGTGTGKARLFRVISP